MRKISARERVKLAPTTKLLLKKQAFHFMQDPRSFKLEDSSWNKCITKPPILRFEPSPVPEPIEPEPEARAVSARGKRLKLNTPQMTQATSKREARFILNYKLGGHILARMEAPSFGPWQRK